MSEVNLPETPAVAVPQESNALVEATPVQYPEVTILRPCSMMECANGHQWQPMLALAKCGYGTNHGWIGCGAPMLAVKMTQCPVCNEPTGKFRLRVDHTGPVPYPVPMCVPGSKSNAEVLSIDIDFHHSQETEAIETAKLEKEQTNNNG